MLKRGGYLKRTPLKRQGEKAKSWKEFRDAKAERDRDEEGLIKCEDWRIGLPRCWTAIPSPDLHHLEGRDGKLLFDESKMIWLKKDCHEAAHNGKLPITKEQ